MKEFERQIKQLQLINVELVYGYCNLRKMLSDSDSPSYINDEKLVYLGGEIKKLQEELGE